VTNGEPWKQGDQIGRIFADWVIILWAVHI
jgi:hypothetical protein